MDADHKSAQKRADELKQQAEAAQKKFDAAKAKEAAARKIYDAAVDAVDKIARPAEKNANKTAQQRFDTRYPLDYKRARCNQPCARWRRGFPASITNRVIA